MAMVSKYFEERVIPMSRELVEAAHPYNKLVIDYGESIGIDYKYYENTRVYYAWRDQWHDLLHELGHLAVHPDDSISEFLEARAKLFYEGNNAHTIITPELVHPSQELHTRFNYYVNDSGIRCWCLDVLKLLDLPSPLEDEHYNNFRAGKQKRNAAQWLEPPSYFKGREQLKDWGIDVLGNKPRPNSEPIKGVMKPYYVEDKHKYLSDLYSAMGDKEYK